LELPGADADRVLPAAQAQPAAGPPARGDIVIVRLPGRREISTRVLESSGRHLWLDLPPVLHRGARLDLLWGARTSAHAAFATVVAPRTPHHAGLALSLGDVYAVERRVLERWKPRRALRCQLSVPGVGSCTGEVINLSLGGLAVRIDRPIAAGTTIEVTLFDGNGAPVLFDVEADVRRSIVDGVDGHLVSVSFCARGVVAMTVARLR
jgi:hypothetical protein